MPNLIPWIRAHKLASLVIVVLLFGFLQVFLRGTLSTPEPHIDPAPQAPVRTPEEQAALDAQVKADAEAAKAEQAAFDKSPAGRICKVHSTWQPEECKELAANKLWITNAAHSGMTYEMLKYLRGEADNTNVSDYGQGHEYQYCWDGYTPSCFYDRDGDGRMDAFN